MGGTPFNHLLTALWEDRKKKFNFFLRPGFGSLDFTVVAMGFIATVTFLTGLAYALPTDSFGLSRSFIFMRDHGGEEFWAIVIFSLGTLGLVCTYFEYYRIHIFKLYGISLPQEYNADRLMSRWVWFFIAILWGFVGCSFLVNVPVSPGAACYVPLGIFSFIVSIMVRDRRDNGT